MRASGYFVDLPRGLGNGGRLPRQAASTQPIGPAAPKATKGIEALRGSVNSGQIIVQRDVLRANSIGPSSVLKGSELWAPIFKVVIKSITMGL